MMKIKLNFLRAFLLLSVGAMITGCEDDDAAWKDRGPQTYPPVIRSLSVEEAYPSSVITVDGNDFSNKPDDVQVMFGSKAGTLVSTTFAKIVVKAPYFDPGTLVDVKVVVKNQLTSNAKSFKYRDEIPEISGLSDEEQGIGNSLTIVGMHFGVDKAYAKVYFGGLPAVVSSVTNNSIVVVVPEGEVGEQVDLYVEISGVSSEPTRFTFLPNLPPVAESLSAIEALIGETITIDGQNFVEDLEITSVLFGELEAEITAISTTSISVVVPEGVELETVDVVVKVGNKTTTPLPFTFLPFTPVIEAISIDKELAGAALTITGTGFGLDVEKVKVTFGTAVAEITSLSRTEIEVVVPAGTLGAEVAVKVVSYGVESNADLMFTYTPMLESLSVEEGEIGDLVTITGRGFGTDQAVITVYFDAVETTINDFVDPFTDILVEVPTVSGTGEVLVSVTVNGVVSTTLPFTVVLPDPVVDAVVSDTYPIVYGSEVTITGTDFGTVIGDVEVLFGDAPATAPAPATVTSVTDTEIKATVPPTAVAGINIVVVKVGGRASSQQQPFQVSILPAIAGAPAEAPIAEIIYLTGYGFGLYSEDIEVFFGAIPATINSLSFDDDNNNYVLGVTVPEGTVDEEVDLNVIVNNAPSNAVTFKFLAALPAPTVTDMDQNRGSIGDLITIFGTTFGTNENLVKVTFGDLEAEIISIYDTQLVVAVPEGITGETYAVKVTVSERESNNDFEFTFVPVISGMPADGMFGDEIQINGDGFGGDLANVVVLFGNLEAEVTAVTDSEINVNVPDGTAGAMVDVVITVNGVDSKPKSFTFLAVPPQISSFDSELNPGDIMTIRGSRFGDDISLVAVTFGGAVSATVNSVTETEIEIVVPEGSGSVDFVVAVNGVESSSNTFEYAVQIPALSITSIDPTEAAPEASVTITGTGFGTDAGAVTVKFGIAETGIISITDTEIVVYVPQVNQTGAEQQLKVSVAIGGDSDEIDFTVLAAIIIP